MMGCASKVETNYDLIVEVQDQTRKKSRAMDEGDQKVRRGK
jgi:hypothetical protein